MTTITCRKLVFHSRTRIDFVGKASSLADSDLGYLAWVIEQLRNNCRHCARGDKRLMAYQREFLATFLKARSNGCRYLQLRIVKVAQQRLLRCHHSPEDRAIKILQFKCQNNSRQCWKPFAFILSACGCYWTLVTQLTQLWMHFHNNLWPNICICFSLSVCRSACLPVRGDKVASYVSCNSMRSFDCKA